MKIDILPYSVATGLAHESDEVQGNFLNYFAKELQVVCRGEVENQVCAISDRLDQTGRQLIKDLAEFVALREKGEDIEP